jgi:hypothetical protein
VPIFKPPYELNVFINIPFDEEYEQMKRAIVFAIYDCGFIARCAAEAKDSSKPRIDKIYELIGQSRLSIHDLCRVNLDEANNLPRFNMPFEFGIFLGAKKFGTYSHRRKEALILDEEKYRYQIALSDIAGQDISAHQGAPFNAVVKVRNWLSQYTKEKIPGGETIWKHYETFIYNLPQLCRNLEFDANNLNYRNYVELVSGWLRETSKLQQKTKHS